MRGLLLVAALAPVGHVLAQAFGQPSGDLSDWLAGAFVAGWVLRGMPDHSGPRVAAPLAAWLFGALAIGSAAGIGIEPAAISSVTRIVLGLTLAAATVRVFRTHPGLSIDLPVALTAGASAAVFAQLMFTSSIDSPASIALFGLVACLAGGMAVRARGRSRLTWTGAGAWLIAGVVAAWNQSPQILSAFSRTLPLVESTLRVTASHRWFGIGIGRDAGTTSHNLLGIGTELGLVGLAVWLVWIGAGLVRAARALTRDASDRRLWGATAGVALYVAALAVSRPLAFSETLFPFVLQFGLMTGLAGSTLLEATPAWTRRPRWQVAATIVAMAGVAAGAFESARRSASARAPAAGPTRLESTPAAGAATPRSR